MESASETMSRLFVETGDCATGCQLVEARFAADTNCQSVKLLGHDKRSVAGGTSDTESVGEVASAAHVIASTQNEM